MERGELSRICRNAVREWDNLTEDQAVLAKKEELLAKEMERITSESQIIKEKKDKLRQKEDQENLRLLKEKQKMELEEAESLKLQREKEINSSKEHLRKMFEVVEEDVHQLVMDYLLYKAKAHNGEVVYLGFAAYFESIGLKKRPEKGLISS